MAPTSRSPPAIILRIVPSVTFLVDRAPIILSCRRGFVSTQDVSQRWRCSSPSSNDVLLHHFAFPRTIYRLVLQSLPLLSIIVESSYIPHYHPAYLCSPEHPPFRLLIQVILCFRIRFLAVHVSNGAKSTGGIWVIDGINLFWLHAFIIKIKLSG